MTEEQNKEEPKDKKDDRRTKLEDLEDDIKFDLHWLIASGYGTYIIKEKLESKWKGKTDILPAAPNTYLAYRDKHKEEIEQQKVFNDARAKDAMEAFQELEGLLSTIETAGSVKDQLSSLRKFVVTRLKAIQEEQQRGFFSPQTEAVMNSWIKDFMRIIDKTIQYEKEIEKDRRGELKEFLDNWFYEIMNGLLIEVREVYGDEKLPEITNRFKQKMEEFDKRALEKTDEKNKKK